MNNVLQCKVRRLWDEDRGFPFVLDFYANGVRLANGVHNFRTKELAEAYARRLGFRYTVVKKEPKWEPLPDAIYEAMHEAPNLVEVSQPTGLEKGSAGAPYLHIAEFVFEKRKYTVVSPSGEVYNDEPWVYRGWHKHDDVVRWYRETQLH